MIKEHFVIDTDKSKIDKKYLHKKLSEETYWAKGISLSKVETIIENSLIYGVYRANNEQIGFAKIITDYATFAYIGDVFIDEKFRGLGLSKMLIQKVVDNLKSYKLRRICLFTKDAHTLYHKYGFETCKTPKNYLEILDENSYLHEQ